LSNVLFVPRHLLVSPILMHTYVYTVMRNHSNVLFVISHFFVNTILRNICVYIIMKN
ncbi:hypothetical protein L9F63_025232, partial [Diploptera punctata]